MMKPDQWTKVSRHVSASQARGRSLVGLVVTTALIALSVSPVVAQQGVEISAFSGYSYGEGISVSRGTLASEFIDKVDVGDGVSYGGAVNFWLDAQTQLGVQFSLQESSLIAEGSSRVEITGMNIYSYHGIATYYAGSSSSAARPFVTLGVGATQYSPSDVMGLSFDSEVRLSGTVGVGVKVYASESIGFSFTGRWTPTYIKSDVAGVYCSPYWTPYYGGGCAVLPDPDYSNQYGLSAGIIIRL